MGPESQTETGVSATEPKTRRFRCGPLLCGLMHCKPGFTVAVGFPRIFTKINSLGTEIAVRAFAHS
jgi:hypothetical protein